MCVWIEDASNQRRRNRIDDDCDACCCCYGLERSTWNLMAMSIKCDYISAGFGVSTRTNFNLTRPFAKYFLTKKTGV